MLPKQLHKHQIRLIHYELIRVIVSSTYDVAESGKCPEGKERKPEAYVYII